MGKKLSKSKSSPKNFMKNNNVDKNQQYQQVQYQQQQKIEKINLPSTSNSTKITRLNIKPDDDKKQTVAVIVTFSQSETYDALFSSIEQKAQEGTKVLVYRCSTYAIDQINDAFNQKFANDTLKQLITQINKVDPDCVVFNWQCCDHYSGQVFSQGEDELFKFVKKMIDRKFLCMFSDFSLKALVNKWNQSILGPNPFKKIGGTSQTVELRFKAGDLKQCPSAQLQTVGEIAEQGKVSVHTMGGTIMYSVNKKKLKHDKYKLQVLTVANNLKVQDKNLSCEIGQYSGAAGHVLVKYPSGGAILASMTHWIELMKVDTSEQKLFQVAARQYGSNYVNEQKMMYEQLDESEKVNWRAQKATEFIQNQAPCTNMKRKAR